MARKTKPGHKQEPGAWFVSDTGCAIMMDCENVSLSVVGKDVGDVIGLIVFLLSFEKTKTLLGTFSEEDLVKGKRIFGIK